jgi:hypothetical protein
MSFDKEDGEGEGSGDGIEERRSCGLDFCL